MGSDLRRRPKLGPAKRINRAKPPTGQENGNGSGNGEVRLRRGWRETIEPGLYRNHRVGCRATFSRKAGVRCNCPFQAHLPTDVPGKTYPQNLVAKTLRDAREEKERRQREGRRANRTGSRLSISEFFWGAFMEKQQLRPATRRNYARVYRTYHEPVVGELPLCDFNEEHVAELISHLEKESQQRRKITGKRNASWIAQQLIPLQSAFSAAVRWKRISENPLRQPSLPDVPPKQEDEVDCNEDPKAILSKDQIEELCEFARNNPRRRLGLRDALLFRFTYEFALRNSEVRGLRWADIDFAEQRITVNRQIDPVTGLESTTKGKRSRELPGPESIFAALGDWQAETDADGLDHDPLGYVFASGDPHAPMSIGLPNRRIREAQMRAGITTDKGLPLIVFHGLRHSRASHLLLDGAPMLEVSRFLGHASQLVTANAYSHLVPDDEFAGIRQLFTAIRDGEQPSYGVTRVHWTGRRRPRRA